MSVSNFTYDIVTVGTLVQAFGQVNNHPFYFRATQNYWLFALSEQADIDPLGMESGEHGFYIEENFGDFHLTGKYPDMPEEAVRRHIEDSIQTYLKMRLKPSSDE